MKKFRKQALFLLGVAALVCFRHTPAEANRSFTFAQTPASVEYPMGAAQPITFRVANNSTAGERIRSVRFTVNNTYTILPNPETFVAPAGWSCTRSSNTRITCTASSATYYITPTNFKDFTFNINSAALSTDRTTGLSSANAQFSGSNTWRTPNSTTSSWTWKALLMTLVPAPASVGTGCQFTLTMTVTNRSTANLTNITSIIKPPNPSYTGGANVVTTSVPANFNLNAGAMWTMVWTYTLTGPAGATARFTACASTGGTCTTTSGTTRTSSTATSSAVTVAAGLSCGLVAAITNNPACLFPGNTATFVMTVANTTGAAVANVVPSALTRIVTGAAVIGAFTGPAPALIANIPNNSTGTFTWTAPVTGNPNDQYSVQGFATANGPLTTATVISTPVQDVDGYLVSGASVTPIITNASSDNAELKWTVTNFGCSNINQVAVAVPGGWPAATDPYALVNNTAGSQVDSWNPVGTTFTSPNATDRIPVPPLANTGDFYLVFSPTPAAGNYIFNVTITDDTLPIPLTTIIPTTVTVNAFDSSASGPNEAGTAIWHEDIK